MGASTDNFEKHGDEAPTTVIHTNGNPKERKLASESSQEEGRRQATPESVRVPNGEQPFVSCLETSLLVGPPEERNLYICWFSDNSIILCNNLSNSFPPVVLSKKPNAIYF